MGKQNQNQIKSNPNETMMLLSRNAILTAVLLATTAVVETQAQPCSDTDPAKPTCGEGLACTYGDMCIVYSTGCQYKCNAKTNGDAGGQPGFEEQLKNKGTYNAGSIVDTSKANEETEVGAVGAPMEAASTTTSGSASATTGVASFLLLAAVGGAATTTTLIVGL